MLPLDEGLNAAILSIAVTLFPDGFDVSEDAPGTYEGLKAHLDADKRLVVYDGGCEGTSTLIPPSSTPFAPGMTSQTGREGMTSAWRASAASSRCNASTSWTCTATTKKTRRWIEILRAEVIGQRLFHERYKGFVDDQRGFTEAYLQDPEATLLWSLW